jgi:hypothetical protein
MAQPSRQIHGLICLCVQIVLADPESRAGRALRAELARIDPESFPAAPAPAPDGEAAR